LMGTDEALGVSVQVGTAWGQADRGDAGGGEEGAELGRVERVAVEEQEALAREEAIHAVEKDPGDLQHPSNMRLADDVSQLDAARRQIDDEEDVLAPLMRHSFCRYTYTN
jgi:hypothetical protein